MLELELGGWPGSCPVAQIGLEHAAILLTQPLKYWDYRHILSWFYVVLGLNPGLYD